MQADVRAPNKRDLKKQIKAREEEEKRLESQPVATPDARVMINVSHRYLHEMIADAWDAELGRTIDVHSLFASDGRVVRLMRRRGGVRIAEVSQAGLQNRLEQIALWCRFAPKADGAGFDTKPAKPPKEIMSMMLDAPHPGLPELDAVVTTPVFGASGKLIARPGYHAEDRVWYATEGLIVDDVPQAPTAADVACAKKMIAEDLFGDFPFATPSDLTHCIGCTVQSFVRRMISGPTPLYLVESPTPGTGKSLISGAVSTVALGRAIKPTIFDNDDAEVRKKITTLLVEGERIILVDNIRGGIDSAAWAAVLTADEWSDRLLGTNGSVTADNHATWIATANNPKVTTEIARRVARIRVVSQEENPEERTGFRHPHLLTWASEHRAELVWSVLVLVRAWQAAGSKPGEGTLGSYEGWVRVIGGILQHAGFTGFLESTRKLKAIADTEGAELRAFVGAWYAEHKKEPVTVSQLLTLATRGEGLLASTLTGDNDKSHKAKLGKVLGKLRDRVFDVGPKAAPMTVQIRMVPDSHAKANRYRLAAPNEQDPGEEGARA